MEKTGLSPTALWPDTWLRSPLEAMGIDARLLDTRLRSTGEATLWQACVVAGLVTHVEILASLSRRFGMPIADLDARDDRADTWLPEDVARRLAVVPLRMAGRTLEVACSDPANLELDREVAFAAGQRVRLYLTDPDSLASTLDRLYPRALRPGEFVDAVGPLSQGEGLLREVGVLTEAELIDVSPTKLVDALIIQAFRERASDVHIEPHENALGVRYRIDGTLHEVARLPRSLQAPVTSRLKVLANLDIADRLRPHDGRAQVQLAGRRIDLRISTLPVGNLGEKTVVRILDGGRSPATFDSLGFLPDELHRVETLFRTSEGLLLVTGPTGSGKTTTLYAALRVVQSTGVNVVTVEDPVEYRLDGVSQVQIHERAGLTFASVLRSILRQDPDVVLVGEIRDRETAEIAIQASMTGHFVLSTLHTNDAASSIMRLIDIGADIPALASALRGVIAQRLVRRVCPHCRTRVALQDLAASQQALLAHLHEPELYQAAGCDECNGIGYKGRLVVPEIGLVTPDIERAIAERAGQRRISELLRAAGLRTLWESGIQRVALGLTTLNELLDNLTPPAGAIGSPAGAVHGGQEDVDAIFGEFRTAVRPAHPVATPVREPVRISPPADAKARVLIVDEDADARRSIRTGLEREGFRVLEAADGQAGLEYIERSRPDIVLLELALPRIDGFGVLRAIRDGAVPATRAIVLTVQDDPELGVWAMELGALDVLVKPVTPRLLASRLHALQSELAA
jgi:type II secretory ATPase GspE/PulE/Tfp pilus assembly ATPase PilB-like protein/CheY-like chemotaxis protein